MVTLPWLDRPEGRFEAWPVTLVRSISLMDEGMQYYSPGRSVDFRDILADLGGALIVLLVLSFMSMATDRRGRALVRDRMSAPMTALPARPT